MNSIREYYEILSILKNKINDDKFIVQDEMFSKEYLKSIILSDPIFQYSINLLKDKHKTQNEKNKNIFHLIKNIGKKQQKENKAIILNVPEFSLFYNEPIYIQNLNLKIYEKMANFLTEISRDYKLISIVNGKSNEEVFNEEVFEAFLKKKKIVQIPNILEEIYRAKNENLNPDSTSELFGFRLKQIDSKYLKQTYEDIINSMIELDDDTINGKKRREIIESSIKENKRNKLLDCLKQGIPHSMRRKIYLYLMGVDYNNTESSRIIDDNILLVDYLVLEDVKLSTENENYFLFEENIKIVLFQLLRDKDILTEIQGIRPVILYSINNINNNSSNLNLATPYPPSGLIPFPGIAFQCAPFSYISNNTSEVFQLFKNYYCKFLSYLSSFTTNKNSILSLIYNFHQIFSTSIELKDLYYHFKSIHYDVNHLVIGWMSTAFSLLLSPDNVFYLYDIIMITDNLFVIILMSLAILYNNKKILMGLQTKEEILRNLDNLKYENLKVLECISKYLNNIF